MERDRTAWTPADPAKVKDKCVELWKEFRQSCASVSMSEKARRELKRAIYETDNKINRVETGGECPDYSIPDKEMSLGIEVREVSNLIAMLAVAMATRWETPHVHTIKGRGSFVVYVESTALREKLVRMLDGIDA